MSASSELNTQASSLEFARLVESTQDTPTFWPCRRCMTLHPVSLKELPASRSREVQTPCPYVAARSRGNPWRGWGSNLEASTHVNFREHHAQIILKYARLYSRGALDRSQQRYLSQILELRHFCAHKRSPTIWLWVRPRVIIQEPCAQGKGHGATDLTSHTLLVKNTWAVCTYPRTVTALDVGPIRLCAHIRNELGAKPSQATPQGLFIHNIHEAIGNFGKYETRGWCRDCSMDYTVLASPAEHELRIRAWYDITPRRVWGEQTESPRSVPLDSSSERLRPRLGPGGRGRVRSMFEGSSNNVFKPPEVRLSSDFWHIVKKKFRRHVLDGIHYSSSHDQGTPWCEDPSSVSPDGQIQHLLLLNLKGDQARRGGVDPSSVSPDGQSQHLLLLNLKGDQARRGDVTVVSI